MNVSVRYWFAIRRHLAPEGALVSVGLEPRVTILASSHRDAASKLNMTQTSASPSIETDGTNARDAGGIDIPGDGVAEGATPLADYRAAAASWPRARASVLILTLNEEVNIADCLRSCAWCEDVAVLDSGSTDRTREIARAMGVPVYVNPFESFGKQRNWAIENIPVKNDWVFHLDADERFTPELVRAMQRLLDAGPKEAGFHVPHKFMFMGRWLRRAAHYPTYQMRLFHKGRMRFGDYGHGQREATDGIVGTLNEPYLHFGLSKGLTEYIDRHNRYSTAEAIQALESTRQGEFSPSGLFSGNSVTRRRAFKDLLYRIPYRADLRYIYTLLVRGAILEGRAGLTYAQLQNLYDRMITLKLRLLRAKADSTMPNFEKDTVPKVRTQIPPPDDGSGEVHAGAGYVAAAGAVGAGIATSKAAVTLELNGVQTSPEESAATEVRGPMPARERAMPVLESSATAANPVQLVPESTPWTLRQRIMRAVWMLVGKPLFRASFHNWYGLRVLLLKLFGAKVGRDVRIRPTVNIEVPWNLHLHDGVTVGDYAILYSLGMIEIGSRTIVSQYAHICAGTHDYTDRRFPLIRDPVVIGADAWIGADAFVGPNVKIGRLSVLGARSSVYKDMEPETVYVGNPARAIKKRELH